MQALSLDATRKQHQGQYWEQVQVFDSKITDAHKNLWGTCVEIFFHPNITPISLDDDHHQTRSSRGAAAGINRKLNNDKARYGVVLDLACDFASGAAISGSLQVAGITPHESFKAVLHQIAKPPQHVNNILADDRGYSSRENTEFAAEIGFRQNGCIKGAASPFTDDPTNKQKFYVNPDGVASAYYATYTLNAGTKMVVCCLRNGSGKLVHMQCAESEWATHVYDLEHAGGDVEQVALPPEDANFANLHTRVVRLTEKQGTPDWFFARMFKITATTALGAVKIYAAAEKFDVCSHRLLDALCITRVLPPPPAVVDAALARESLLKKVFTDQQINRLTIPEIQALLDAYNLSLLPVIEGERKKQKSHYLRTLQSYRVVVPSTPAVLTASSAVASGAPGNEDSADEEQLPRVLLQPAATSGPAVHTAEPLYTFSHGDMAAQVSDSPEKDVEQHLIRSWFFNRASGSDSNRAEISWLAGHINEKQILASLSGFLNRHYAGTIVRSYKLYGIIQLEAGIAASPDGVADIRFPDSEASKLVAVEVKTKVAARTLAEVASVVHDHGDQRFFRCSFISDVCKGLLTLEHRTQILHQATVLGTLQVLYVVASQTTIIYAVLVDFTAADCDDWLEIIRTVIRKCVPYLLQGDSELVLPRLPEAAPGARNTYAAGCPDNETFVLYFHLVRKLERMVRDRGYPFPFALRLVPILIVWWNKLKGMTDTVSRIMYNIKVPFHSLHPYALLWMRAIMMMVYNGHLLHRIFSIEGRLSTIKTLEQLRQMLKSEGSFTDSIADLVRGAGFAFTNPAFLCAAPAPPAPAAAAAAMDVDLDAATARAVATAALGSLHDASKNRTKLAWLNTADGIALRRRGAGRLHIPQHAESQRRCILCDHHTTAFCKQCSSANVYFFACVTASKSKTGRQNVSTCFEMMHNSDTLVRDHTRSKIISVRKSLSVTGEASVASKRSRLAVAAAAAAGDGEALDDSLPDHDDDAD